MPIDTPKPHETHDHAATELRRAALAALQLTDPGAKCAAVNALWAARQAGAEFDPAAVLVCATPLPGRPEKPEQVNPRWVGKRGVQTREGRAMMMHALAHIEFNAINLALDAIWRFADLPHAWYQDWLRVAKEEAEHFTLLVEHLAKLGHAYGDFPAHNGLWELAERTHDDVLARVALVPRTMEARGLDATPAVRAKLAQAGDIRAAYILDIILRDEIGHVAIGNHWFNHLCRERGENPLDAHARLAQTYHAPQPHGPYNLDARRQAGFSEEELALLVANDA